MRASRETTSGTEHFFLHRRLDRLGYVWLDQNGEVVVYAPTRLVAPMLLKEHLAHAAGVTHANVMLTVDWRAPEHDPR